MTRILKADICVIGAGSGGLSVAAGAAEMGADTVLIEKHLMGGDCLNTGCVPSKSLLAAAHTAESIRNVGKFGITTGQPDIDFAAVRQHVQRVIESIAPHDSVERFEGLGVRVIKGAAHFIGPRTVAANDFEITARRFVIATGSSAAIPPVDGLANSPYLTNDTIFDQKVAPEHLIILGGGPIGIELAQAHRELGCRVTVLEMFNILPKDDTELVSVIRQRLVAEGIDIREGAAVSRVERAETGNGVSVFLEGSTADARINGSHLLIAAGRVPNIDGLDLDLAGIGYSPQGITVDRRLRTTNRRVFAIGDVVGGYQFTHVAGYHAGIFIRNALFRLPAKTDYLAVPWVTYTAPELAQVGLTEQGAQDAGHKFSVLRADFSDNDRARAERDTDGMIKVMVTPKGKILGVSIVGAGAGDILQPWVLAMSQNLKIGAMAGMIAPYPTRGEISKRVAGSFYTPKLYSERTKRAVRLLSRLG